MNKINNSQIKKVKTLKNRKIKVTKSFLVMLSLTTAITFVPVQKVSAEDIAAASTASESSAPSTPSIPKEDKSTSSPEVSNSEKTETTSSKENTSDSSSDLNDDSSKETNSNSENTSSSDLGSNSNKEDSKTSDEKNKEIPKDKEENKDSKNNKKNTESKSARIALPLLESENSNSKPYAYAERSANTTNYYEYDDNTNDDLQSIINDAEKGGILFTASRTFDLTKTLNIKRNFDIKVADGVEVTFNGNNKSAFNVTLPNDGTFKIINNGKMNFNNVARAFWVHGGGDNAEFIIEGDNENVGDKKNSVMNINGNTGYAIAAMDHYGGKITIKDTSINVNAAENSAESGLYLGNQNGKGEVLIENANLNLNTPSTNHTSVPFTSNAKNVTIKDSKVESTSKSHYNFEITSSAPGQVFNIENSDIKLITPADADPHRTIWGFNLPEDSIGLNTNNTQVNIGNSKFKHVNEGFNERRTKSISMADTEINVDNSEMIIGTLGSQYFKHKTNWEYKGLSIDRYSKVTIKDFDSLTSKDLPKIIIDGGSVELPMNEDGTPKLPNGTVIENSTGEELTHFAIKEGNLPKGTDIKISADTKDEANHPEYLYELDKTKLHNGIANVWAPAVTATFYPTISDAAENKEEEKIQTTKLPRGASISIMGDKKPNIPKAEKDGKEYTLGSWIYYEVPGEGEKPKIKKYKDGDSIPKDVTLYPNYKPLLETEDKKINVGNKIDLTDVVKGASDFEDGNLTDKVEIVDDGGFDANIPGTYTITVKVTDSIGQVTEKTATITVRGNIYGGDDRVPPTIPDKENTDKPIKDDKDDVSKKPIKDDTNKKPIKPNKEDKDDTNKKPIKDKTKKVDKDLNIPNKGEKKVPKTSVFNPIQPAGLLALLSAALLKLKKEDK